MFNAAAPPYQEAINKSGYNYKLKYEPAPPRQPDDKKRKNRKRKILWFNPPYNYTVKTNVAGEYLKIVDECFPIGHPLRKIFNRNTMKVSYSTTANMAQIISGANSRKLNQNEGVEKTCSCSKKDKPNCPMGGNCFVPGIVYQAIVEDSTGDQKSYIGLSKNDFKKRLGIHNQSFKKRDSNKTCLSSHIWSLKDQGLDYTVTYRLVEKAKPFTPVTGRCQLCLTEKFYIMYRPDLAQLNKREEMFNHCRHKELALLVKPSKRRKKKPPGN